MNAKRAFLAGILLLAICGSGMAQANFAPPESTPYTPFLISFVPMVSFPFGYYDTSMSLAAVGGMAHDVSGFMGAGVFNMSRDVQGFQGAGVFNLSADVDGFQGAGVFNMAKDVDGFQGAGVFNIAGKVRLFQAAGVFNIADDLDGFQWAGVFNMAGDVRGGQIAGVFNVAHDVRGVQVGLVHIADNLDGIQVGLVNIARDGVNGPSAWLEPESGYAFANWQNGSRFLYSVISVGAPLADCFDTAENLVGAVGLGTRLGARHGLYLDVEVLSAAELAPYLEAIKAMSCSGDFGATLWLNSYPELRFRLGLPVGRSLSIVAGLTVDVNLDSNPNVPLGLRQGWTYSDTWFGEAFTAYTRWYLGLKL